MLNQQIKIAEVISGAPLFPLFTILVRVRGDTTAKLDITLILEHRQNVGCKNRASSERFIFLQEDSRPTFCAI